MCGGRTCNRPPARWTGCRSGSVRGGSIRTRTGRRACRPPRRRPRRSDRFAGRPSGTQGHGGAAGCGGRGVRVGRPLSPLRDADGVCFPWPASGLEPAVERARSSRVVRPVPSRDRLGLPGLVPPPSRRIAYVSAPRRIPRRFLSRVLHHPRRALRPGTRRNPGSSTGKSAPTETPSARHSAPSPCWRSSPRLVSCPQADFAGIQSAKALPANSAQFNA